MTLSRSMGSRPDSAGIGAAALDVRMGLAAMLALAGASSLAIRPGVFPGAPASLVTGNADWTYSLGVADFATTRGASDGAQLFGNSGPISVGTDEAPGTSGASRWDVLYVLHPSYGENGDTSSTPLFGVAKGNASTGTPAVPAIPVGALELGRNLMTSAATSTSSAGNTLTQTWRYTALRGCPILVRSQAERDELTALASAAFPITVDRLDTGTLERNSGSGWVPVRIPALPAPTASTATGTAGNATANQWVRDDVLGTYAFTALAGHRYRAFIDGLVGNGSAAADLYYVQLRNGGAAPPTAASPVVAESEWACVVAGSLGRATIPLAGTFKPGAGTVTLGVLYTKTSGTGLFTPVSSPNGSRQLYAIDLGYEG